MGEPAAPPYDRSALVQAMAGLVRIAKFDFERAQTEAERAQADRLRSYTHLSSLFNYINGEEFDQIFYEALQKE